MRGTSFAWAVIVSDNEDLPQALLTAGSLKRTNTTGSVIAIVGVDLNSESLSKLNSAFDWVMYGDVDGKVDSIMKRELLTLECWKVTTFTSIVVLDVGIIALSQIDTMFDVNGLFTTENGHRRSISLHPDKQVYSKVSTVLHNALSKGKSMDLIEAFYESDLANEMLKPVGNIVCYTDIRKKLIRNVNALNLLFVDKSELSMLCGIGEKQNDDGMGKYDVISLYKEMVENIMHDIYIKSINPLSGKNGIKKISEDWRTKMESQSQEWIAVVGMSCRFPGANNLDEYWDLLVSGRNTSSQYPPSRSQSLFVENMINANFLKCNIAEFDPAFFSMSPAEACITDPQTRLLLETSWEAFEDAGINVEKYRNTDVGVFYGSWMQEYKDALNDDTPATEDTLRKYLSNAFGASAAKLSFFYGFKGPNLATESGCSSSMVAVDLACKSLQRRECPLALATGSNLIMNLSDKVPIWAHDGICKTFDSKANGYARAEGVATLVLKRYTDAVRDGDKMYGIIRGCGTSQEGATSRSFGSPTVESEAGAMKEALLNARVSPDEVDFVEAHATGTSVGDPIEATAICQAYAGKRNRPLYVGSGKTNIGHAESSSGLAGMIKVFLSMQYETIPPHINMQEKNPKVNFDAVMGEIPVKAVPWPRSESRPRMAGCSSFGITGTDVHVILQEAPRMFPDSIMDACADPWPVNIITVSAKTVPALLQHSENLAKHLETCNDDLSDIAYAANACRMHHAFRSAFVGSNKEEIIKNIVNHKGVSEKIKQSPKVCFTFPGITGTMNFEPVANLYASSMVFQMHMDHCDALVQKLSGTSMKGLYSEPGMTSSKAENYPLKIVNSFILSAQYGLVKLWEHWGITPDAVMGHCLGEVAAGIVSGVLTLQDALQMMLEMTETGKGCLPGLMLAINVDKNTVSKLMSEFASNNQDKNSWMDIACVNCQVQTTIAGSTDIIHEFKEYCASQGLKSKLIKVDMAIHSRALDPIMAQLKPITEKFANQPQNVTYISSSTGTVLSKGEINPDYWVNLYRNQVDLVSACKSAEEMQFDAYLEIGFDDTLSKLTKYNFADDERQAEFLPSLKPAANQNELVAPLTSLSTLYTIGFAINWDNLYQHMPVRKVALPHYPFQRKSYWFEKKKHLKAEQRISQLDIHSIHPLLGASIPNASGKEIFQNYIVQEKLDYVYDHCISTEVIYPAAGHLEIMLSSGCLALDDITSTDASNMILKRPPFAVKVEGFTVHQPLHVMQAVPKKIQTILEKCEDGTIKASVYSENPRNKNQWATFATGTFSAIPDQDIRAELDLISMDNIVQIQERCSPAGDIINEFYQQLAQLGLVFGPTFRSLKNVYTSENETLAEIEVPSGTEDYICHPIVSDALIQLFILHSVKQIKKLHVPVKIGKYIHFPGAVKMSGSPVYAYCSTEPSGLTSKVYLLDAEGSVLGLMMYPELISTTTQAVLEAAGHSANLKTHPTLYEQYWKAVGGHTDGDLSGQRSSTNKWIVVYDGNLQQYSEFISDLQGIGRDCLCVPLDALSETISKGKLQEHMDKVLEEQKNELEGILFMIHGAARNDLEGLNQTRNLVEPLLCVSKYFLRSRLKTLPRLHVVTSGTWYIGDEREIDQLNPVTATIWGYLRTMRTEMPGVISKSIDLDPDTEYSAQLCSHVLAEILSQDDKENEVVYRGGARHVRRLRKDQQSTRQLQFPDSSQYTAELPATKILADLKYIKREPLEMKGNEVEIEIRAASLNFKDVLNIMKPTQEFEAMKTIGLDYSGIITGVGVNVSKWKVGDAVFGCSFDQGTIGSHLISNQGLVAKVPPNMTFSEAATLPAVFLTAWYCMVDIANLKPGQTILIHAASGGVGIVAIQIAKLLGVNIIGTAGSCRKRNFVRSLGVEHVFSSRNLEYGDKIKELTNGKGVDMILNCLTGPGFKETSLDICREGGHFTEISKVDIWQPEEVTRRKQSVHYNIVYMPDLAIPVISNLLVKLTQLLKDNDISPLPYSRYDASGIVDALTFLQKAKQIGKVVVEMPFFTTTNDGTFQWEEKLFNENSTYLITGGFGDIGLAVGSWMVSQGAKHLILISRRAPTEEVENAIANLEAKGAVVITKRVDISDYSQCEELLLSIRSSTLPPLRGIHHCAGVINDTMISKQDWSLFEKVFAPKVKGAYNLHSLTMKYPLEFFVTYSSLTSTFGNIGQSNYTSANAYMDSLAELRHAKGLKVLNINWGQWDAGMAKGLELYSAIPFSVKEGINALEKLMKQNRVAAMAADVNMKNLVIQAPYLRDNLLVEIEIDSGSSQQQGNSGKSGDGESDTPKQSLKELYFIAEDGLDVIKNVVVDVASRVLGLQPEEVDHKVNFNDMGMDSIMAIEYTNTLQSELGDLVLGFIDMEEYGTVVQISDIILSLLKCEEQE